MKHTKKFPKVRCQTCGLIFSTKPVRLRYQARDWRKCQNKCNLQPVKKMQKSLNLLSSL